MEANPINKNGFTLIEMVISFTIIGILSAVASSILVIGINGFIFMSSHAVLTREVQNSFNILHDNILNATPDGVNTAKSDRFYFVNKDGDEAQFQYDKNNGFLRYRIVGKNNWHEILNNIQKNKFTFTYYTADGSSWNNSEILKRVRIEFTVNLNDGNKSFETEIFIRN